MSEEADKLKFDKAKRLVKARRFFGGHDSARSVALAQKWNYNVYKAHESGLNGFSETFARCYAKTFNVNLAWLVSGSGLPQGDADIVEELEATVDNVITMLKCIKPQDNDMGGLLESAQKQLTRLVESARRRQG